MNKFIFNSCISLATTVLAATLLTTPVFAATNQALGSIAGVSADLDNSNIVTLNSQGLALIKRAFLTDGTALDAGQTPGGEETLPRGTTVRFLIYVNNPTDVAVADIRVTDTMNVASGFTFVTGSTIFNEVNVANGCVSAGDPSDLTCTAPEEAAILADVILAANKRTEAVGAPDDTMSFDGTDTVSAGGTTNTTVTANANSVWGMVFEATIN